MRYFLAGAIRTFVDDMEKSQYSIWFKIYYGVLTLPLFITYVLLYSINRMFNYFR